MSVSSDTCELFDDADDVRCYAVNAMLHDAVGDDTNNYAQDDTYDDTQNDTRYEYAMRIMAKIMKETA